MAAVTRSQPIDFAADGPDEARSAIAERLASEPTATRKVYAALAQKVWSLLVERRFDDEIRDWHDLLLGVRARIRTTDEAAAERVTALSELLRESISFAQTSPAREVAKRPRARAILEALDKARGFVARRALLADLGIGSSHFSNLVTALSAHDLLERRGKGKEAEYRITRLGRQLIGADGLRDEGESNPERVTDELAAQVQKVDRVVLCQVDYASGLTQARHLTGVIASPELLNLRMTMPPPIIGIGEHYWFGGDDTGAADAYRTWDPATVLRGGQKPTAASGRP